MLREWPFSVGSEEVVAPMQGVGQQQEVMVVSAPPRPRGLWPTLFLAAFVVVGVM